MTTDLAIIGAGPYGLSLAATLQGKRVENRIFGTPMQTWREHMPSGMKLKSEGFASSLYDGRDDLTLRTYCSERRMNYQDTGLPVTLKLFCDYGVEFQARKVPHLEMTDAVHLARAGEGFRITLGNGQDCTARRVVIATGISHYHHVPECLAGLPPELAGHASHYRNPEAFAGKRVAVVGGGASAIDMAALLGQAGADTRLIVRGKRLAFLGPPAGRPRSFWESVRAPQSGLGPGWRSRICTDLPFMFRYLPEDFRHKVVRKHLGPSAGWWTRAPIENHVNVQTETRILSAQARGDTVALDFVSADGKRRTDIVDHVISATGYRPDLRRLPFLDKTLRAEIAQTDHIPHLSGNFETSVAGLYVTGLAAAYSFGPLLRFAYGADFTARTLGRHFAGTARKTARTEPHLAIAGMRKNSPAGAA
jgi:cation diffusion facilitator CzcD-associated flavoprotein CzcO